jgi:pimeloyl-ACP methyl ester carboxylesterase
MRKPIAVTLVVTAMTVTAAGQDVPRLQLEELQVGDADVVRKGTFTVYEDRESRTGRTLELDVVVIPARGPDARPDPVFVFTGGPGVDAAAGWRNHLGSWMREKRDIVLMTQRGTGGSSKLDCELPGNDGNLQGYFDGIFDPQWCLDCLAELQQRADLTKYTTPIAMDDYNDLRAALGYDQINLHGGSYGSRAILVYMRRHPETVRTATLNGIAPIAFTNPLYHASSAQQALDLILEECAADPTCSEAYPDLAEKFQSVISRLDREPARTQVTHPQTGGRVDIVLTRNAFAEALRMLMYFDSRRIPYLVDSAWRGDYETFAQLGIDNNRMIRNWIAFGMLLCVTCAEDIPRIEPADIPRLTDGTFLGDARVRGQIAACELWPRGDIPDDYGNPVTADVPVLLFSGRLDPVTPPEWGERAARNLPQGLHVEAPGSHGVGGACIRGIHEAFLESGTIEGLDTSCVESMREGAFYVPSPPEADREGAP